MYFEYRGWVNLLPLCMQEFCDSILTNLGSGSGDLIEHNLVRGEK